MFVHFNLQGPTSYSLKKCFIIRYLRLNMTLKHLFEATKMHVYIWIKSSSLLKGNGQFPSMNKTVKEEWDVGVVEELLGSCPLSRRWTSE